jgi:hypothetical protein
MDLEALEWLNERAVKKGSDTKQEGFTSGCID